MTAERPSRRTRARGALSARSARTERSAFCSWRKPTSAFRIRIAPIATASATWPSAAETAQASRSSQIMAPLN
jgi:hypothetical protein